MKSRRLATTGLALALFVCASDSRADGSLFARIGKDPTLSQLFPDTIAKAEVQDGFLLGTGTERTRHLPDGRMQVDRTRRYTRVRDTESGRIATLPEPWEARSTLIMLNTLRLVSVDTRLTFKRSGDAVFSDHELSERHEWLFGVDRTQIRASKDGTKLTHQSFRGGKRVESETYDYPPDSMPLEIVGILLSVTVARKLDRFDFQLLVPGGDTHGVRAETHRTRDLRRFAKGYRVPPARLTAKELTAVVDMRLDSPVKYVFYPHHFYMAYSAAEPWKLTMMWGGDPDENLQAFRVE